MLGRRRKKSEEPGPGAELRAMVLQLDAGEVGLPADGVRRVWGVVMDTGLAEGGWYCLVALADGTTSLYTSSTFGVIGAGAHEPVRLAADALLLQAEAYVDQLGPPPDDALPAPDQVVIRLLTFDGQRAVTAPQDALGYDRHPVSPLFHAAHEVITQVRLVSDR